MPYCHICVQPTVDYIGVTRTVGVVWACRRFDYSHFCRRFGVAVLTIVVVQSTYVEDVYLQSLDKMN